MIYIKIDNLINDFYSFLNKRNFILYNIINKKQILLDEFLNVYKFEIINLIRNYCDSKYFDNNIFNCSNEQEAKRTKLLFVAVIDMYLCDNNIDIVTNEMIQNGEVNEKYFDIFLEYLNLNEYSFIRQEMYKNMYL